MSDDRARRLTRIAELRQRELDQEAAHLARARAAERAAQDKLAEAEALAAAALAARANLASGATSAADWTAQESWLATQRANAQRASESRMHASQAVDKARESVVKMRVRVRGLETLVERVQASEREAQAQADRRFEDEVATQTRAAGPGAR
ncbi:MAG TPA: flagellar export protein FliJ [Polyangiaceae bacterium]|nr:flagellar export protein FliJ [Polyangiaceae bacterium]